MTSDNLSSPKTWWLFGPKADLVVFLGSTLLAMLALWIGHLLGFLHQDSPEWTWVVAVLLVDVAHVWSTSLRSYLIPQDFEQHKKLYLGVPILCWVVGCLVYTSLGSSVFWRILAYFAVFHFVRQQFGWVKLYQRRVPDPNQWLNLLDQLTIYAATIYPLVYWHTHLPRNFWWFLADDFTTLPSVVHTILQPVYWMLILCYLLRALHGYFGSGIANPGRDMIVATTAWCWYVGIITLNSDYAFTVTNVLIHGIPYIALIYYHNKRCYPDHKNVPAIARHLPWIVLSIWALAYFEELLWDRLVWHDKAWLFGSPIEAWEWHFLIVPLLAVPQLTHYLLDGFIWRGPRNPQLKHLFSNQTKSS